MSLIEITKLNMLYKNIEASSVEQGAWRYRVFQSPSGLMLKNAIQEVLKNGEVLEQEFLKDLKALLQISLTYSRILISDNPGDSFWNTHILALKNSFEQSRNYLDSSMQNSIMKIVEILQNSAEAITLEFTEIVLSEIREVKGRVLILPETPSIGYRYRDWVSQLDGDFDIEILTDKGEIQSKLFGNYALILFPGSPSKYLRRPFFDIYLRALLFSGFAPKVTFISPRWSSFQSDLSFTDTLFSGMKILSRPNLNLIQGENASEIAEVYNIREDFEYREVVGTGANFELFESGGSVPCRLIPLGNHLVYPVEQDSRRVTTLQKSLNSGSWEIVPKHPFQDLRAGDFLVACVGRSETDDLRDRAALKMGMQYSKFQHSQSKWKELLHEKYNLLGPKMVENELKTAGVTKFARARYWMLPEAIQPALPSDFQALLKALGINPQEAQRTIALADHFDALLISEGREAGKALTSALDEEDFMKLEKNLSVEITLENFGDAIYLISPVLHVPEIEIACRPSQVRQVISYVDQESLL